MPKMQFDRSPPRRRRNSPDKSKDRQPASRQNFYCEFCKAQLATEKLYKDHCESAVHKQKEITLRKAVTDGLHFCYTCGRIFPTKVELDAHCLMSRHHPLYRAEEVQHLVKLWQKGEEAKPIEEAPKETSKEVTQVERRVQEVREKNEVVVKISQARESKWKSFGDHGAAESAGVPRDSQKQGTYCYDCELDCLNDSNYKIHIESWKHRAVVDRKNEEKNASVVSKEKPVAVVRGPPEQQSNKSDDEKDGGDEHGSGVQAPPNLCDRNEFFCDVCRVPLANVDAYYEHCRLRRHLRMVSQSRRPFGCYLCDMVFEMEHEFNYHLRSQAHVSSMERVGKPQAKLSATEKQDDDWVEKRDRLGSSADLFRERSRDKDKAKDRSRSRDRDRDKKNNAESSKRGTASGPDRESRSDENRGEGDHGAELRKVEIVDSDDTASDLRYKLKGKNIIITKQSSPDRGSDRKSEDAGTATQAGSNLLDERGSYDKKAQELELQAKFKKLAREYEGNLAALKEKLTKEREIDIVAYQQYEVKYQRLCEEEDSIREDLRVVGEDDPKKEGLIRNMIRIQRDMREVRGELEFREMMIIKREGLFREKFPNSSDTQVVIPPIPAEKKAQGSSGTLASDLQQGPMSSAGDVHSVHVAPMPVKVSVVPVANQEDDLRIQLERERLLKRLGPELDAIDARIREKLLSAIFDEDAASRPVDGKRLFPAGDERRVVQTSEATNRQVEMEKLIEREKQLLVELADLRNKPEPEKLKLGKSLVPQYDDVEENAKSQRVKKRRERGDSSDFSDDSSSNSDEYKPRRKQKKASSGSKGRVKSRKEEHERKRRKSRSPGKHHRNSREHSSKKKKADKHADDWTELIGADKPQGEKKTPSKEPDKSMKHRDSRASKGNAKDSDFAGDHIDQPVSVIPVLGGVATTTASAGVPFRPMKKPKSTLEARKEQFALWKNSAPKESQGSPKDDVWDIAFTGGQVNETAPDDTVSLFTPAVDASAQLPADIWNILRSVSSRVSQTNYTGTPSGPPTSSNQPLSSASQKQQTGGSSSVSASASSGALAPEASINQEAGGRVRSILKKMKEAPVSHQVQEVRVSTSGALPLTPGLIPGLEGDASSPNLSSSLSASRPLGDTDLPYQNPRVPFPQHPERTGAHKFGQLSSYTAQTSAVLNVPRMSTDPAIRLPDNVGGKTFFAPDDGHRMTGFQNPSPGLSSQAVRSAPAYHEPARDGAHFLSSSAVPFVGDNMRGNPDGLRERNAVYPIAEGTGYDLDRLPLRSNKISFPSDFNYQADLASGRPGESANSNTSATHEEFNSDYQSASRPATTSSYIFESGRVGRDPVHSEGNAWLGSLPEYERLNPDRSYAFHSEDRDSSRGSDASSARARDPRERALQERPAYAADLAPPRRSEDMDGIDRPPVRQPGESEESFYNRFERYYELKRRKEVEERLRLEREREIIRRREEERRVALEREEILQRLERERLAREEFERERLRLDRVRDEEERLREADKRRRESRRESLDDGPDIGLSHRQGRTDDTDKRDAGLRSRRDRSRERIPVRDDQNRGSRNHDPRSVRSDSKDSGGRRSASIPKSDKVYIAEDSEVLRRLPLDASQKQEQAPLPLQAPAPSLPATKWPFLGAGNRADVDWRSRVPSTEEPGMPRAGGAHQASVIGSKQQLQNEIPISLTLTPGLSMADARVELGENVGPDELRSSFPGRSRFPGQREQSADASGYASNASHSVVPEKVLDPTLPSFIGERERTSYVAPFSTKIPSDALTSYAHGQLASGSHSPHTVMGGRSHSRDVDGSFDALGQFAQVPRSVPNAPGLRQIQHEEAVQRRDPRVPHAGGYEDDVPVEPLLDRTPVGESLAGARGGGFGARMGLRPAQGERDSSVHVYGSSDRTQFEEWHDAEERRKPSGVFPAVAYSEGHQIGQDTRRSGNQFRQEVGDPLGRMEHDPPYGYPQLKESRYRDHPRSRGLEQAGVVRMRPPHVNVREEHVGGSMRYPYRAESRPRQPSRGSRYENRFQTPY